MLRRAAAVRGGGWVAAAGHRGLFHLSKNNIGVSIFPISRFQGTLFAQNNPGKCALASCRLAPRAESHVMRSAHAFPRTHNWCEIRVDLL